MKLKELMNESPKPKKAILNEGQTVKQIEATMLDYLTDEKAIEACLRKTYKNIESIKFTSRGTEFEVYITFKDGFTQSNDGSGACVLTINLQSRRRYTN